MDIRLSKMNLAGLKTEQATKTDTKKDVTQTEVSTSQFDTSNDSQPGGVSKNTAFALASTMAPQISRSGSSNGSVNKTVKGVNGHQFDVTVNTGGNPENNSSQWLENDGRTLTINVSSDDLKRGNLNEAIYRKDHQDNLNKPSEGNPQQLLDAIDLKETLKGVNIPEGGSVQVKIKLPLEDLMDFSGDCKDQLHLQTDLVDIPIASIPKELKQPELYKDHDGDGDGDLINSVHASTPEISTECKTTTTTTPPTTVPPTTTTLPPTTTTLPPTTTSTPPTTTTPKNEQESVGGSIIGDPLVFRDGELVGEFSGSGNKVLYNSKDLKVTAVTTEWIPGEEKLKEELTQIQSAMVDAGSLGVSVPDELFAREKQIKNMLNNPNKTETTISAIQVTQNGETKFYSAEEMVEMQKQGKFVKLSDSSDDGKDNINLGFKARVNGYGRAVIESGQSTENGFNLSFAGDDGNAASISSTEKARLIAEFGDSLIIRSLLGDDEHVNGSSFFDNNWNA